MNVKREVNRLWEEFRQAINTAYADANKRNDEDGICLKDFAENISWHDGLAELLACESVNEKRHRSNRPSIPGFSVDTAAKLILMSNVADGSRLLDMPKATIFLLLRKTAAESIVLGFLSRHFVTTEWRDAVAALDYAQLMKNGGK